MVHCDVGSLNNRGRVGRNTAPWQDAVHYLLALLRALEAAPWALTAVATRGHYWADNGFGRIISIL